MSIPWIPLHSQYLWRFSCQRKVIDHTSTAPCKQTKNKQMRRSNLLKRFQPKRTKHVIILVRNNSLLKHVIDFTKLIITNLLSISLGLLHITHCSVNQPKAFIPNHIPHRTTSSQPLSDFALIVKFFILEDQV